MKLKGFKLCSMLLLSWVLWLVSWLALHVVTYLPVLTDLSRISCWTLNNRTFWYSLKRNAWTFCNHKGTKIRVWAREIKTVSIQPIVSSFVSLINSQQKVATLPGLILEKIVTWSSVSHEEYNAVNRPHL